MSLDAILTRARGSPARLLLAGGDTALLGAAAARLSAAGLRSVSVVGEGGVIPEQHSALESVAARLRAHAPERVRDAIDALDQAAEPLRFALGLCALGQAEALVTGPGVTPDELLEATRWVAGEAVLGEPVRWASWLMLPDDRLIAFADSVSPQPIDFPAQEALGREVARLQARLDSAPPRVVLLPGFRGEENVLIFPGGIAGAFALPIARRLAGALLLGPLLLGSPFAVAGVGPDAGPAELVGTAAATVLAAGGAGT